MRRTVVVVLVVVVTVVAAGLATSAGGDSAHLTLPAMDLHLQGIITVLFVAAAVVAFVAAAFVRPGGVAEESTRPRRSLLSTVVVILLAVLVATVLSTIRGDEEPDGGSAATAEAAGSDPEPGEVVVEPRRVATALLTLIAIGAVVAVAVRTRRPSPGREVDVEEPLRAVVVGGRSALDRQASSVGAREAILACWRVLEQELSALGRPRRDTETGEEYLRRALAPLDPPVEAVARLAGRVELARWSTAPLDDDDVQVTRAALDAVLAGIPGPVVV